MDTQTVNRDELAKYLEQLLDITRFKDYCPNGLQVEGKTQIRTLITGVTASLALIEAAIELQADAILVHHGYFWRDENPCIIGHRHRRIKLLLQNDINLFAYHLPLDHHPELGNNAQLALRMGWQVDGRFGENDLGWLGTVRKALAQTVGDLVHLVEQHLGRSPLVIGDLDQPLGRIAWCSGGAQSLAEEAALAGASAYLSGEISEQTVHLARETGMAYLACGHHATERYGIEALGEHVARHFGIQHEFVDIANPV